MPSSLINLLYRRFHMNEGVFAFSDQLIASHTGALDSLFIADKG